MIIKEKQTQIISLDTKINNLHAAIKLIAQEKAKLIKELSQCIKDELNSLTPEKVMTMPHEVFSTEEGSDILSNYMTQFKFITASNYWAQTGTQAAKVAFNSTQNFEEQFREVMLFLPYCAQLMIQVSDSEMYEVRAMKILDPSAGKNGIFTLGLSEDSHLYLFQTLNSKTQVFKVFDEVKEGVEFIYKNYGFNSTSLVA